MTCEARYLGAEILLQITMEPILGSASLDINSPSPPFYLNV